MIKRLSVPYLTVLRLAVTRPLSARRAVTRLFTARQARRHTQPAHQPLINLLPWRQQRRHARQRFWLLWLTASALLLCALAGYAHLLISQQNQRLADNIHQQQILNQRLHQRLNQAQTALRQQQTLAQQRQRHLLQQQKQRQQIQEWRTLLEQLADTLPASAWLSGIQYQQDQLRIEGVTHAVADLQTLTERLNQLPGFHLARPGDTQFTDEQFTDKQWRFYFLLTRDAT